jgi:hypothetical protein
MMEAITEMQERLRDLKDLQSHAKTLAKREFFCKTMSTQINELIKAITEFKKNMPDLKTDKSAGARYKYQSLPALLGAITPLLAKNGCTVMQPVHTIGNTTYVITLILHTSGQYIRSVTAIPEQYMMIGKMVKTSENLQAMGGALTYTKRHALKSMLGIDADEDNDGNSPYAYRPN